MAAELWKAVEKEDKEEVRRILEENRDLDLNWKNEERDSHTALHLACLHGQDEIVSLLLTAPTISVNAKNWHGNTAFKLACDGKRLSCVKMLLEDPRVNPNLPDNQGHSPLWSAAMSGFCEVVRLWIVSGREMDLGEPGNERNDAIWAATNDRFGLGQEWEVPRRETAAVLERFRESPGETREEMMREMGVHAGRFALIIFLCDGLLKFRDDLLPESESSVRFLRICQRLPLDLQKVVCCRSVGSMKLTISRLQSEAAFRSLALKFSPR